MNQKLRFSRSMFAIALAMSWTAAAFAQNDAGRGYYSPPELPRTGKRATTIQEVPPPSYAPAARPDPLVMPAGAAQPLSAADDTTPIPENNSPRRRSGGGFQPTTPNGAETAAASESSPSTPNAVPLGPPQYPVVPASAAGIAPPSPLPGDVGGNYATNGPAALPPPPFPTTPGEPPADEPPDTSAEFIADKLEDGVELTWQKIAAVWNFPITQVDGKPITVGTVVCCLILLWFGYCASKIISWWFGARFLPRMGMHQSAVAPVQTITFYVLTATFTMLSLRLANVPLTAFTFLGGAIAIGVGFGSQNVINNFISGLILLAERPIRVGDVIQFESLIGKVTQIGPRSTHVTTANNVVIVVPNSKLLEGTVVNWTLSDNFIRTKITCGVAYGSRTRDVERIMLQVAEEHPEVLQDEDRRPLVAFAEFGDNALVFELHFWITLAEGVSRTEVESDLRYAIDDQFRGAGIVMAYPQRDVHLNVLRPLEVRMVGEMDRLRSKAA